MERETNKSTITNTNTITILILVLTTIPILILLAFIEQIIFFTYIPKQNKAMGKTKQKKSHLLLEFQEK